MKDADISVEDIIKTYLNEKLHYKGIEFAVNLTDNDIILDSLETEHIDLFGKNSIAFEVDQAGNIL